MTPKPFLGEFEQMVLAAILRLGDEAYGASIIREIADETGRSVPSGSLSITVDRMERKGLVKSKMGKPDPARGGRPKRYVTVTDAGLDAVRESRAAMLNLWNGLEARFEK